MKLYHPVIETTPWSLAHYHIPRYEKMPDNEYRPDYTGALTPAQSGAEFALYSPQISLSVR